MTKSNSFNFLENHSAEDLEPEDNSTPLIGQKCDLNSDEKRKNDLKDMIAKFGSRWIKKIKKQERETNI